MPSENASGKSVTPAKPAPEKSVAGRPPPLAQPWVVGALVGSVLFLVSVLVILVVVTPDATRWLAWSSTTGVVGSYESSGDRADVVYAFQVDDRTYEGDHAVPSGTDLKVAAAIGVRYDPADPQASVPAAAFEDEVATMVGIVLLAFVVAVVVGIVLYRWRRRVDGTAPSGAARAPVNGPYRHGV